MLLIGGYTEDGGGVTGAKARGISAYEFSRADGGLRFLGFAPAVNPSYLLTDRKRSVVYAVREKSSQAGAGVVAYQVGRDRRGKPDFKRIADHPISGDDPCHLAFAGDQLVVSSFSSAQLHFFPRLEDGGLGQENQTLQLSSSSGRPARAHCTAYQATGNRILVCDLGDDKLKVLTQDDAGQWRHLPAADLSFPTKSGPRHIALHPDGKHAVVNGECIGVVHLLDISLPAPRILHTANALPERVIDEAHGAAIRLGHNGKMVYATDRNFSVINGLRIDESAGKILFRDTTPSGGEHPRDLTISPNGQWLLTANTQDHTVGVFRIDPKGALTHYHTFRKIPSPSSFAWL